MSMEPISVIRAKYVAILMDVSERCSWCGLDCDRQNNLPAEIEHGPDSYLPLNNVLECAQCMVSRTDIGEWCLAIDVRMNISIFATTLHNALMSRSTLKHALAAFVELAGWEQSNVEYRIEHNDDEVQVRCSSNRIALSDADYIGEWLRIMSLVSVVRHFAGSSWMPTEIAFHSDRVPEKQLRQAYQQTYFSTDQPETSITIPAVLLDLSAISNVRGGLKTASCGTRADTVNAKTWDFPESLREIVQAQLGEGYPDINLAAKIIGISVRTLQRRLKEYNLSYTDIVQEARFKVAECLLKDPAKKIIETALAVGYEDPAHFTRAFRRFTGVTPNEYRRLNYA